MTFGETIGAAAASLVRYSERTLHRFARPAAFALAPLLIGQARSLQRGLIWLPEAGGPRNGTAGTGASDEAPIRLLAIGDSTATGVGTEVTADTLAARTAAGIADSLGRATTWNIQGLEGSTSTQIAERFAPAVSGNYEAVLVLVGTNDALKLVSRGRFERSIRAIVASLRLRVAPGGVIALAGIPQIDTFVWLPQPIRSLIGGHARSLDDGLQRIAAAEPGVMHLPTPAILDRAQHAADGFHPSAAGYAAWADIIVPRIARALTRAGQR